MPPKYDFDEHMPASLRFSNLPAWPRFLTLTQAAAYVGVSPSVFQMEVKQGRWEGPMHRGPAIWDRVALDAAADRRSGRPVGWGQSQTAAGGLDVVSRTRRYDAFVMSLLNFNVDPNARREAICKSQEPQGGPSVRVTRQLKPPDNITVGEARQQIRARIMEKRAKKP